MSRYRTIHCRIWNDDKFPFMSDDCQLAFFHLLTTTMSSPFGLFNASVPALAAEKRWDEKRYRKAFAEAFAKGLIKHSEKHLLILIPQFLKYNKPSNPNVLLSWGKIYKELPDCELKFEFNQILMDSIEGYGEAFHKAFAEAFPKGMPKTPVPAPDTVPASGPGQILGKKNKSKTIDETQFEEFWKAYPSRNGKKVGKDATSIRFASLSEKDITSVIIAAKNYALSKNAIDGYAVDPVRFFRSTDHPNGLWREWLEPETPTRQPRVRKGAPGKYERAAVKGDASVSTDPNKYDNVKEFHHESR